MSPSDRFRARLVQLREAQNVSQRDLVSELATRGITLHQSGISLIENGQREISLDEAVAITQILRVPLELMVSSWRDWT